jgi:hypothetical protein
LATGARIRSVVRAAHGVYKSLGLGTALLATGFLLVAPTPQKPTGPPTAAQVWPGAKRGVLAATLADGSAYTPSNFADALTSVGTAPTADGKDLRLLIRHNDGSVRQLRRLPMSSDPSYQSVTISGQQLVWAENTTGGKLRLWAATLDGTRAPVQLTADMGAARFYESQYDMVIQAGRVYWAADDPAGGTDIRSIALTGGAVTARAEAGTWQLSAWPWLVDGVASASGSTTLRNMLTGQDVAVAQVSRAVTNCSPTWCRAVSFGKDGYPRIQLMHPDGSARRQVATGEVETQIADVAVLDKYEVYGITGPDANLTGNAEILIYDIARKRTVELSPDASNIDFRNGVLWWSTGSQVSYLRHALDLRTLK